jgi:transcription antitermination protein NusB
MNKISIKGRKKARRMALQALYGWSISHNDLNDIEAHVFEEHEGERFDEAYFKILLYKIPNNLTAIEKSLEPHLNIKIDELDLIELNILRIAAFELRDQLEIPYRVVINEALELAKTFGATESFKFVNGVLDKLAKDLRKTEV